jgi:hypothetical protein
MVAQYGSSCSELAILGCDADLSDFIPGIGFGISVYEICPESCTDCGEEEEGCWEDGELYADGDQYWLNECEFIYCEELGSWSEVIEIDDCGENDCIDDPDGMVAQYGSSCSELAILGCDADLSDFIPGIGFGISVYEICPESCTDCGEEGCWEGGELYADGDQYWLNECEFIYCEELGSWSEVIEIDDCGQEEGCAEGLVFMEDEFYPIGFQWEMSDCSYYECVEIDEWMLVDNCEEEGCWEGGELYADGDQYWLNECEFIYCEELGSWSEVIEIDDCGQEDGCWEEGEFYCIGCELFIDDCTYVECEGPQNWSDWIEIDDCEESCDTVYIEVPVIEYVTVIVTDTVIEYQDLIITEYIDCDTGLPCESGISEILDKSITNGKIYNLLGQEINRREGIYIEGGEVKYRF